MPNEPARPSFDLTTQPWIPVQRLDGTEQELSLHDLLQHTATLRRIVGDVPTQEFALVRLVLAIVHDAVDGPDDPDDWSRYWEDGLPAEVLSAYLDRHRERFDLLHPEAPFFQVADLRTAKDEVFSLDRIVADVPNGDPFFTMRARGVDRLGFAEAARWVVHAHAYDPSGIKSGAVGDPRVKNGKGYPQGVGWAGNLGGVLAEGATLQETLLLNLVAADVDNLRIDADDRPAWRRDPAGAAPAGDTDLAARPTGVRDLYTWQSRRLRLRYDADGVYGALLAYGDPLPARNMHNREPMTAWRRSPAQEKKHSLAQVYLPREHDPARSAWRGLAALVTGRVTGGEQRQEAAAIVRPRILDWVARLVNEGFLEDDHLIRPRLFGAVYGTQQSVIDEILDDGVAMHLVLLHERDDGLGQTAVDAVEDADKAVTVLGDLAQRLAQAAGAEADGPRAAARDLGFAELDGPFRDWLGGIRPGDDPDGKRAEWQLRAHRIVRELGRHLVDQAGDAAWTGRLIETRQTTFWLTAGGADLRFRSDLNKALPMTAPADKEPA
ncbi:type I-E CRISPR-associated protein Cse1/CasA [Streptomonospora litoralis]|uniref:CRISPR-associated protein CasA/Cse1 n=1 Tax=Streptomonospora litoralis TaxID=2498135 RepID=A0A4P6PUM5_9ACTN|nr:type I-E CRISPR-associated protein Cse1/CasA [Streptomonospora litoralis]QBI51838.1 CRISPR-associated protein CasA/Cse1 [Streptomonospora litoralis]